MAQKKKALDMQTQKPFYKPVDRALFIINLPASERKAS